MNNKSKCLMAQHKYCRKSYLGYCAAEDRDLEFCPYLQAIEEIARMAVLDTLKNDDLK